MKVRKIKSTTNTLDIKSFQRNKHQHPRNLSLELDKKFLQKLMLDNFPVKNSLNTNESLANEADYSLEYESINEEANKASLNSESNEEISLWKSGQTNFLNKTNKSEQEIEAINYWFFTQNYNIYFLPHQENILDMKTYILSNMDVIRSMNYHFDSVEYKQEVAAKELTLNFFNAKPLMILDIDETMIYCNGMQKMGEYDIITRPFLKEFLDFLKCHFNLGIFTAGEEYYAYEIVKHINKFGQYFDFILSREHCIEFNNIYVKDLSIIKCAETKFILDNNIFSFANNLDEGILIKSFENNPDDDSLLKMMRYIEDTIINSTFKTDHLEFDYINLYKNFDKKVA